MSVPFPAYCLEGDIFVLLRCTFRRCKVFFSGRPLGMGRKAKFFLLRINKTSKKLRCFIQTIRIHGNLIKCIGVIVILYLYKIFLIASKKIVFSQLTLEESSKEETAFTILKRGLFHFMRMLFGLCGAISGMMRLMDKIFGREFDGKVFYYLDDIIVNSG